MGSLATSVGGGTAAAAQWRMMSAAQPAAAGVAIPTGRQSGYDDIDWFFQEHASTTAAAAAAAAAAATNSNSSGAVVSATTTAAFRQQQSNASSNNNNIASTGSEVLRLPPWNAQAASAVSELTSLAQQHGSRLSGGGGGSNSTNTLHQNALPSYSNDNTVTGLHTSSNAGGGGSGSCDWQGTAQGSSSSGWHPATGGSGAALNQSGGQWPHTGASSAGLAALSAHQAALSQSAFHQSLLKAWGSYASMDGSLDDSSSVCSICLGSYRPGALITALPCTHMYHKECVMPWLLQQGRQATCPMCKAEVFA